MTLSWQVLSFIIVVWSAAAAPPAPPQPTATFPPHGGAFVTTLPAEASAWIDGTYVGQTPVYVDDLLPGRHAVTLSRSGWQPQTTMFDVFVGRIEPVSVVMQRVPQTPPAPSTQAKGQGALAVRGGPAGAKMFIDGVLVGTLPVEPRTVQAGYHIVTVAPPGKKSVKQMRIVDVYPNTTTAVAFVAAATASTQSGAADDILEPVDTYVPLNNVVVSGNDVTIHYRGMEVECAIGSRTFTINGKAGTLEVPPAVVGGRIYLPLSLLQRVAGK